MIHNSKIPFIVKTPNQKIEDIGTSFNVNAYPDEDQEATTLVEGSVKVSAVGSSQTTVLQPGQQAVLQPRQQAVLPHSFSLRSVDIGQVIAWKQGRFEFSNTELTTVMRQISRWYDVRVTYNKTPGHEQYGGGINSALPLSKVLQLLEANGLQFELNGKELKVILK